MSFFKHEHRWSVLAAQPMDVPEQAGLFGNRGGYKGTAVMYVCRCGEHKTETFPGTWDLATLQGKSAADVAGAFLKTVKS